MNHRFDEKVLVSSAPPCGEYLSIRCYDNGGKTFDRYTVIYMNECENKLDRVFACVGMSERPFHPQGFGQHSSAMPGKHLGKRIQFESLPKDCQTLVMRDLKEILKARNQ